MAGVNQGTVPAKPDDAGRAVSGPGRITAVYAALSALWILLSDGLIGLFVDDAKQLMVISTVKGWAFVALTSAILFGLMRRMVQEHEAAHRTRTEALRLLEVISEKSTDAIYVKDRAGRYLLFNRKAGRFVGKDPREVIGLDDRAIYPPAGAEMLMASDRKIMDQGEVQTLEETLPTPLGVLTFLTTKGPIYGQNGDPMGLFGIARDISERKESEAKYSRIVNTAAEGILVMGPDEITTFVNAKMAEMLGYSSEEMFGRPMTAFMLEEDNPDYTNGMELLREGQSENCECCFQHKNGQAVWTSCSARPILDGGHGFQGCFAMFTDITARKRPAGNVPFELRHE